MSKIAVLTIFAAALAFGSFMAVTSHIESAVKGYYERAVQCLEDGEYQKAADLYAKYLAKHPDNKNAMLGYLAAAGKTDRAAARGRARDMLDSDVLTAPDFPHFAQICESLGDRELNASAYKKWLQESPGNIGSDIYSHYLNNV
jgi:tetratricopeptide (TPR) repeat protein